MTADAIAVLNADRDATDRARLLDAREPLELAVESVPGAVNIPPLGQLRARLGELPKDRVIQVICRSGGRAYYATRILLQNSFSACTLSGGMPARFRTRLRTP